MTCRRNSPRVAPGRNSFLSAAQPGFTTVDEGIDLVEQAYPGRLIPPKVAFLLAEIVDSMRPGSLDHP